MDENTWYTRNRQAVMRRIRWLQAKPDGTLLVEPSGSQFVVLIKSGTHIRFLLVEQARPHSDLTQSSMDILDPLNLVSPYTQAMLLGLIWVRSLRRVFFAGLGGGRIPLVLHHHFPHVQIECAEIDRQVIEVAKKYFALPPHDSRFVIVEQDARVHLLETEPSPPFDLIMVDAFLDNHYSPYSMATREFFQCCLERMSGSGALVVNLLSTDRHFKDKIKTLEISFPALYLCPVPGNNYIAFATPTPAVAPNEIKERAMHLQQLKQFPFPFNQWADQVIQGEMIAKTISNLENATILKDASPPTDYFDNLPLFDAPFLAIDKNGPCPCGSGIEFYLCHGRDIYHAR